MPLSLPIMAACYHEPPATCRAQGSNSRQSVVSADLKRRISESIEVVTKPRICAPAARSGSAAAAPPVPHRAARAGHRDRRPGDRRRHHRRDGRRRAGRRRARGRGGRPPRARPRARPPPAPRWCNTRSTRRSASSRARSASATRCAPGAARGWRSMRSRRGSANLACRMSRAATRSISPAMCSTPRGCARSTMRAAPPACRAGCSTARRCASASASRAHAALLGYGNLADRSAQDHARAAARRRATQGARDLRAGRHRRHRCRARRGVTATTTDGRAHPLPALVFATGYELPKHVPRAATRSSRPGRSRPCRSRSGCGRSNA